MTHFEKTIRNKLNDKTIVELKAILDICQEKVKTDSLRQERVELSQWQERVDLVDEILTYKVNNIFR
jgi:hypothetical protein